MAEALTEGGCPSHCSGGLCFPEVTLQGKEEQLVCSWVLLVEGGC